MSIKSEHPLYADLKAIWQLARDSYDGEIAIKEAGTTYLPATSGQILDGQGTTVGSLGALNYLAYKTRAIYPDLFREAIESAIGTMHRKPPPVIDLPDSMRSLETIATSLGESLAMLLRRVNVEQLGSGRVGVLGDLLVKQMTDGTTQTTPVISVYKELAVLNWDDSSYTGDSTDLRLVVLDESTYEMNDQYEWDKVERYRILALCEEGVDGKLTPSKSGRIYATATVSSEEGIAGANFIAPQHMGQTLEKIPFSFINSRDISPSPDLPPLLGLALLCLAIYRGESDYRQSLHESGQDTLVEIGSYGDEDEVRRTGTGARIQVPLGGDAKYIGVDSQGLSEQRTSLENDYARASQRGGQLIDATSKAKESGEALRIRIAAQTTTLPQVAQAGAAGVEQVVKEMSPWFGSNPEAVSLEANTDFVNDVLDGQTLLSIANAKASGIKISDESIHAWLFEQGITKKTYEEELAAIANEEPTI